MFITSTVNAKSVSTSDLPLVVLAYGERSYLVKVTEKYEDIADLAIKVFGIDSSPASVVLETSTLDICQGRAVRIHKSAWESIRSLVAEVRVRVSNEADDARGQKAFQGPLAIPSSSKQPQGQVPDEEVHSQKGPGGIEKMRVAADQEDAEDEDEAEQLAALSSFAGSVANSDYGEENQVSEEDILAAENAEEEDSRGTSGHHDRSLTAGRALSNEIEEHNPADEDFVGYNEAPVRAVKAEPVSAGQLVRALGGFIERDLQDVRDDMELHADVQGADRPIKQEKMARHSPEPRQEVIGSSQPQSQLQQEGESSRFIINVEHRPSEQVLMFKTRGEHTVGKVLSKACKEFQLDYDSATLKLIVEIEGEDGGEILSDCDNGDTMARSGAVKDARFIIVTDDD